MTAGSDHRAGVAIVRIEIDAATPDRTLIRVETVDDVVGGARPEQRVFADSAEALDHLRAWMHAFAATR
jgi:hypothetical protein